MKYHVLPGDSLVEIFRNANIEGEIIVCRECLIEGDTSGANLDDFWNSRAAFINQTYDANDDSYRVNVAAEFEKLQKAASGDEVNLWFEHELFCQTNMWFCLSLLSENDANVFRVAPVISDEDDIWKGFGSAGADELVNSFRQRIKFDAEDINLGKRLWNAFRDNDKNALEDLSEEKSDCFPYLKDVCQAAVEIKQRPQKRLKEIIASGETDFSSIFQEFKSLEGVYGFGDSQVKRIMQELKSA